MRPGPADLVLTPRGLRFGGRLWPVTVGRGGLTADKSEGDGATPRGVLRIVGLLYRADRMSPPAPWARPLRRDELWCDDPACGAYNHLVRAPHGGSHERLWRPDRLYDLVMLTDWNWPQARPGRGSAIFVHRWRRPGAPTEGCIALAAPALRRLARACPPGTRLFVP